MMTGCGYWGALLTYARRRRRRRRRRCSSRRRFADATPPVIEHEQRPERLGSVELALLMFAEPFEENVAVEDLALPQRRAVQDVLQTRSQRPVQPARQRDCEAAFLSPQDRLWQQSVRRLAQQGLGRIPPNFQRGRQRE